MPFKFNPLTGNLDLVNTSGGGAGVDSVNTETGPLTIVGSGDINVSTTAGTITISSNSYNPSGW